MIGRADQPLSRRTFLKLMLASVLSTTAAGAGTWGYVSYRKSKDAHATLGKQPSAHDFLRTRYPMVGNESFNPTTDLNPSAQIWHRRLLEQDVTRLPIYNKAAKPDHIDIIGERLLFTITPMLAAFRVAPDLRILDMIDMLVQRAYIPLSAGAFLNLHHMAHSGISCLINQMAYCYDLNRDRPSPGGISYGDRANQWQTYIDTIYYPQKGLPADNLRHRITAGLRGMVYHWRWKVKSYGWEKFDEYRTYYQAENRTDLGSAYPANGLVLLGDRYIWDHDTPLPMTRSGSYGWQPTHYAQYTLGNLMDLALEGIFPWDDVEMVKYAKTAEFVLADGLDNIRENVNSKADGGYAHTKMRSWAWVGMGRWSSTIRAIGDRVWALKPPGLDNVIVPGWMVVATA